MMKKRKQLGHRETRWHRFATCDSHKYKGYKPLALYTTGCKPVPRGMTLVELMIAVVVMVLMMLAFGMIVTEAQKVVTGTQNQTRGNNTAEAIARTIRNDLAKITKNGFLCITKNPAHTNTPVLIFSTAGISSSKTCELRGLGGISTYGYAENAADTSQSILLRQSWVLTSSGDGSADELDIWNTDFSTFQKATRAEINTAVNNLATALDNNPVSIPPNDLTSINRMWQVLSQQTLGMSFTWNDGTVDASGNMVWYGVDYNTTSNNYFIKARCDDNTRTPPLETWELYDYGDKTVVTSEPVLPPNPNPHPVLIEYNENGYGYRALWTHHNQNNWPKTIKVKFTIRDEEFLNASGGTASQGTVYEVIVPLE